MLWVGALAWLLLGSRVTRFAALWLLVGDDALISGSRPGRFPGYHYVPSMGFSLALAAAVVLGFDWLIERRPRRRRWLQAAGALVAAFLVVRFAQFKHPSAAGAVRVFEPCGATTPRPSWHSTSWVKDSLICVPPPDHPDVEERYLEPMLRWLFDDNELQVIVERTTMFGPSQRPTGGSLWK